LAYVTFSNASAPNLITDLIVLNIYVAIHLDPEVKKPLKMDLYELKSQSPSSFKCGFTTLKSVLPNGFGNANESSLETYLLHLIFLCI
jgi:hypothetical protein